MKYSKVTISEHNIVGNAVQSTKLINLSSINEQMVRVIMTRIPNLSTNLKFLRLNNGMIFDCNTGKPTNKSKNKTIVTIVVDEDDTSRDKKIISLSKHMNIVMVSLVVLSGRRKIQVPKTRTGKLTRFCNYHHTDTVADKLNAFPMSVAAVNNASYLTIIKTPSSSLSHISGMLLYCNSLNKAYEIEEESVFYDKGWMSVVKKTPFKFIGKNYTSDKLVTQQQQWQKKVGYTIYLPTTNGIKSIDIQQRDKIRKKKNKFIVMLQNTYNSIKNVLQRVYQWLTRNKKTKADTRLAFSVVSSVVDCSCHASAVITSMQSKNASRDIKRANKVIATMQMNKMLAKTGIGGNKTMLSEKQSSAFNAYLTAITSYNMTDALVNANNLAASRYKVVKTISILGMYAILLPYSMLTYKVPLLVMTVILFIVDYYTDILPGPQLAYVIGVLYSTNFLQMSINLVALSVENVIGDNKTAFYRSLVFALLACLGSLLH